ncbi:aromatic-ring-hydroxylating dioxygenase subunit beta [Amycolatopsis sp. CA-161197]|uniref:aromatic-ring-hydroxylating dioxygenase subunit beta n=1 Tax=Amycolatopsis sp. CA-161197 TaxID=3239922 RepID=UPI003D8C337C
MTPMRLSRTEAEDLLYAEAEALDDGDLQGWLDMFTDDAVYWVPARRDSTDPSREVSLIHDDRERMRERVWRLTEGPAHAQIPQSSTRRVIGNVRIREDAVLSNFILAEDRKETQRVFAGEYRHRFRWDGDRWRIAAKTVVLVNCESSIFNLTFVI